MSSMNVFDMLIRNIDNGALEANEKKRHSSEIDQKELADVSQVLILNYLN